jgi:hypothetical protein
MSYQYRIISWRPLCPNYPCQIFTMKEIMTIFNFYFLNLTEDLSPTKMKERDKLIHALVNSNSNYFTYFFTKKPSIREIHKTKSIYGFGKQLPVICHISIPISGSDCFIASVQAQEFTAKQIAYIQKLPSKILDKLFNRAVFESNEGCLITKTSEAHLFRDPNSIRVVVIKGNRDKVFNCIKETIIKLI